MKNTNLDESLKQAVLVEMVPTGLTESLLARVTKDDTFETTRDMVISFLERRIDFGGLALMGVGHVNDAEEEQ